MPERAAKVIALGGVGGDAHSVGIVILRRALERAGYRVCYLATQNTVDDLRDAARRADAVLVSNMDGHARHYLRELPFVQEEIGDRRVIWYLGGHPSIAVDENSISDLKGLGFDRVFPRYVEPEEVVAFLDADLGVSGGGGRRHDGGEELEMASPSPGHFEEERDEVLMQWPTGLGARNLEANAEVLRNGQTLARAQEVANRERRTLLHPRVGVAGSREQAELFGVLQEAGADVLSFQIDSLTRNNAYQEIELLLKGAADDPGYSTALNGFPAVNHGVAVVREIASAFRGTALQVRHSTRDPRLLAEISFAAGVAGFEGGALSYNLPYYRDYSPREALGRWRYVDTLAGRYDQRFGVTIDREFFGVLTATLVPPCLAVAVNVLEALLAAGAGVRSVSLGYAEQGHRSQDLAAVNALRRLGRAYLDAFSFSHVAVHTVFHQYMGAFPLSAEKSRVLLRGSTVTARLSRATRLMTKTCVEALRIPSATDNARSLALVRETLDGAGREGIDAVAVAAEEDMIVREASAIVDAALVRGNGDFGEAAVAAVGLGLVDIPFSPSLWNVGRAMSVRDCAGAVRFAESACIPLPPDIRQRHRELVEERLRIGRRPLEQVIEEDILSVVRGEFDSWPLETVGRGPVGAR